MSDTAILIGRILLGGYFVFGGIRHFFIAPMLMPLIAARGLPYPKIVLYVGTVWQIFWGLLFMAGLLITWSGAALILFTVLATIMLVNFWDLPECPERFMLQNQFMSNVGLTGGILLAGL